MSLGAGLLAEILGKRGGGLVRFVGRPHGMLGPRHQPAFVLRQFRGEKLQGAKFVRAGQLMKRRQQLGKLHGRTVGGGAGPLKLRVTRSAGNAEFAGRVAARRVQPACRLRICIGKFSPRAQISRMSPSFETLVEEVRTRSVEEKEELKFLLERALIAERRREIQANHRRSQGEVKRGKLKFSSSIVDLKKSLAA